MNEKLNVRGAEITVTEFDDKDYISLTDMLKAFLEKIILKEWTTKLLLEQKVSFARTLE